MKRISLLLVIVLAAVLGGSSLTLASKPSPDHKVTICHGTASNTNPWVRITVDVASIFTKGHATDNPKSNGSRHARGLDIIPPFEYDGTTFPGQNWNERTRAIYDNGCKTPPPPPPPCKVNCEPPPPPCKTNCEPPPKPRVVKPAARIIGPAGDPYFRYVLNNRRSERPVAFVIQPWGRKVVVPGGCVFRTGWHYERPFTNLTVRRGNGTLLARENSGPGGFYGPLYKGYTRGLTCY